jgi:hypothetical protein
MHNYWLRSNGKIATAKPSPLNGKTPQELVIMAETRQLLQLIINTPDEASPELTTIVQTLLRSRFRRTSPLTELTPAQRIAWLDEHTHIQCAHPLGDAFTPGKSYRVKCMDIPTSHLVDRQTLTGTTEEVLVTGRELLITIFDALKRVHGFAHTHVPATIKLHALHHTETLISHFHIPEAKDITHVFPATYKKHLAALAEL